MHLLGDFALVVDGDPVVLSSSTQRVIALLALEGTCGRSRLAGRLWPDATEMRARASLRTALWRVQQAAPTLILSTPASVALNRDATVDIAVMIDHAHRIMAGTAHDPADPVVRNLNEGELLPDWDDEWLSDERERLHQLRVHVLETVATQLTARAMYGLAIEASLAALRLDPLRESAHRALIAVHIAEGNVSEALKAFRKCQDVLHRELGVDPSAQTMDLLSSVTPAALDSRRTIAREAAAS